MAPARSPLATFLTTIHLESINWRAQVRRSPEGTKASHAGPQEMSDASKTGVYVEDSVVNVATDVIQQQ
ncbi:hypothetical protein V5799_025673, partial [Amblyomma americanum]